VIFKVDYIGADMCGNTWAEGPPDYVEANDIESLWQRMGCPRVTEYVVNDFRVPKSRTPRGKGYGIWEENPDFNWLVDMYRADSFEAYGRSHIRVEIINPKSPEEIEV
jgi:hypothetical protein